MAEHAAAAAYTLGGGEGIARQNRKFLLAMDGSQSDAKNRIDGAGNGFRYGNAPIRSHRRSGKTAAR